MENFSQFKQRQRLTLGWHEPWNPDMFPYGMASLKKHLCKWAVFHPLKKTANTHGLGHQSYNMYWGWPTPYVGDGNHPPLLGNPYNEFIKNACWWPSLPYEWELRPKHIWPSCYLNGGDFYDKVLSNHDLLWSKKKSVDFVLSKIVIIRICKRDGVIQIRSGNTRSAWQPPGDPNFGFGTTSFRITAVTQLKNQFLGRE